MHQNTFAIAVAGRGFGAHISTELDVTLPESACVYCGNCIAVCPTGALMSKSEYDRRQAGTWDEARQDVVTTICPYCGVGCNLELHVQDDDIVNVTSPDDHDVTRGNLCVKGRFGFQFVQNRKQRRDPGPDPLLAGDPVARCGTADDGTQVSRQLPDWFQQEIDRVAMEQGLVGSDAYLEQWHWGEPEERDGAPDDVLDAVEAELVSRHEPVVEQAGHVEGRAKGRVDDALERQRVEDRRAFARPAHGRREIRGADVAAADVVQDAPRCTELVEAEIRLPYVRDDRVEHELRHVRRMRERVALADIGAVRDAVDDPRVDAERLPQRFQVGDDVVRAEELPPVAELGGAGADRGGRRRGEIGASHRRLQGGTVECPGAGAEAPRTRDNDGRGRDGTADDRWRTLFRASGRRRRGS